MIDSRQDRRPKAARGFTLMELMVVVAVLAILGATLTTNWNTMIQRYYRSVVMNNLHHAFQLARQSAVTHGKTVTLCPLDESGRCGGDWNRPVTLFYDPNNLRKTTDEQQIIYVIAAPDKGSLTATSKAKRYFQYTSTGMNRGTLGGITWCPPNDDPKLAGLLLINITGRVRHAIDRNGDGIVENAEGRPLSCPAT